MCAACGIIGHGPDWVEGAGHGAAAAPGRTRSAERQRRIALVNEILALGGVRLSAQGGQLVVRSATGRTKLVSDLAHVWAAADLLGRRQPDPLDDAFLRACAARNGHSASP